MYGVGLQLKERGPRTTTTTASLASSATPVPPCRRPLALDDGIDQLRRNQEEIFAPVPMKGAKMR